ncbi:HlyD family efflux transporter periplasmic adaptor subunit [Gramella sp. BOM4]|nr:HlyD family efflux transporter periplasmic adaptor subunit [Christiangramia bathymodioli]
MIRWGNGLFLGLIVLVLFFSWFVKYPDIIPSEAVITSNIPPHKEYAKTSGKLEAILVTDNEHVTRGQPLAVIENSANYEDVYLLKKVVDTLKFDKTNFSFPIDKLPILFLGEIETQFALFENSYFQYILNKELRPFANEALANKYSIKELNSRLKSLKSQRELNRNELDIKRRDLQRNQQLYEKGVISTQDFEGTQLEYAQAERNFKNFETSISQLKESISNANKTKKGTEINQEREELLMLKKVIQSFSQLKKAINDWENTYVLKSAIEGRVSFLNFYNNNQTVKSGDLVFTIIPSETSYYVAKLKTPSQNSGKIKIEQDVNIKIDNYPDSEFGILNGTVKNISAIPDEDGFYYVDVALPENLITSYDKEIDFKQEMSGTAEIITEDLRLIERFFYQIRGIF